MSDYLWMYIFRAVGEKGLCLGCLFWWCSAQGVLQMGLLGSLYWWR